MGFRRFHLRGLNAAQGEWNLVCMAWNLKRWEAEKMDQESLIPIDRVHCRAECVLLNKVSGLALKSAKCDALLAGLNPTDS
jgi:hypothetical protein